MTQQLFAERLSNIKKRTGVSQDDFDLVKKVAPEARGWSGEVVQFYLNRRSLDGKEAIPAKTIENHYLSFFDVANDDDFFWQEKARVCAGLMQGSKNNEFLIGFSAMLIMAYGPKDGVRFAAAFERILKTGLFLHREEIIN